MIIHIKARRTSIDYDTSLTVHRSVVAYSGNARLAGETALDEVIYLSIRSSNIVGDS